MSSDIQQNASVGGELAPNLWGRTDFQKYDSAWAQARNWIVDYRGGLFTRAGSEFGDIIQWTEGQGVKFVEFQFSPDTANTYVCIFTDLKVRFVQDNAYVLEAAKTVASLANDSGDRVQFTSTAHGFENGDWIKLSGFDQTNTYRLNGRTVQVANKTANTFTAVDPITGDAVEIASVTNDAGSAFRIYTITSPYAEGDLAQLKATQVRDYVRLTHPDYAIQNLIRNDTTDWEIAEEVIGSSIVRPTNPLLDAESDADGESVVYKITAVNAAGDESNARLLIINNTAAVLSSSTKFISIEWTASVGAVYYNIYRSRFIDNADRVYPDQEAGFIGQSIGTVFTDNGITADFSRQDPITYNPFANGAILSVSVTVAGTGYNYDDTITWPAGGSGAAGGLIANDGANSGAVRGVYITDPGSDYTGTSVTASGGASFAGVAELSPASGNNPHCSAIFQQRMVYGATNNNPLRIFGSRTGQLSNFNYTQIGADNDSYEFDLDAPKIAPIRHLVPMRGGMLVFNQIGCWLVYGNNDEGLTGFNVKIDYQNAIGASQTAPVLLDAYVVYVSEAGQEMYMLAYDDNFRVYQPKNLSLISNHLFIADEQINSLTYAPVPFKTLYATQTSGRMLSMTVDNENGVYGTTPLWTKGYYRYVMAVEEDYENRVYVAVERVIDGNTVLFFERFARRNTFDILEDSFCLDAGLQVTPTRPAAKLTPSSLTGAVTFTASAAVFSAGDVGKILRCGSGKATITGYTSTTVITGTWTRVLEETFPEATTPAVFLSGDWTLDSTATTVRGLWHLEGESVDVLADGEHITGKTVTNGAITLTTAASRIVVGIPFSCIARTLPLTAADTPIESRRKGIKTMALRMYKSIGLKIGNSLDKLRTVAIRARRLGHETADKLQTNIIVEPVIQDWERDAQVYVVQNTPRPAAILNFIRDVDLGDDKE